MRKLGWFLDGDWWQREAINEAADELDELRAARADDQKAFARLLALGRAHAEEIAVLRRTVGTLVELLVESGAVDEAALRARLEGEADPEPQTPVPADAWPASAATEEVTAVGPAPVPVAPPRAPAVPAPAPLEPVVPAAAPFEPVIPAAVVPPREPVVPAPAPPKRRLRPTAPPKRKAQPAGPQEPKAQCARCWHFVSHSRTRIIGSDTVCDRCSDT